MVIAKVTNRRINPESVINSIRNKRSGAVVLFLGTVRAINQGRRIESIEYEVYRDMAEKRMMELGLELKKRFKINDVAMIHREGKLGIGEISVAVAVSAEHREEAFNACRFAMDRIKSSLPIWKKERLEEGESIWVEGIKIRE